MADGLLSIPAMRHRAIRVRRGSRRYSSWSACRSGPLASSACALALGNSPCATSRRAHSSSISAPPRALSFFNCISTPESCFDQLCLASIRSWARSSSAAPPSGNCWSALAGRLHYGDLVRYLPRRIQSFFSSTVTGSARRAHRCAHDAGRAAHGGLVSSFVLFLGVEIDEAAIREGHQFVQFGVGANQITDDTFSVVIFCIGSVERSILPPRLTM